MAKRSYPRPTHEQFMTYCRDFFDRAIKVLDEKGQDYQEDGKAFGDIFRIASEMDLPPSKVLYVHASKHLQAIRRYVKDGQLVGESCQSRLHDAANYMAMISMIYWLQENSPDDEQ